MKVLTKANPKRPTARDDFKSRDASTVSAECPYCRKMTEYLKVSMSQESYGACMHLHVYDWEERDDFQLHAGKKMTEYIFAQYVNFILLFAWGEERIYLASQL